MTETPQLYQAAVYYVETLGFSVIPIIPGQKRPAIPWTEYQQRRPYKDELVAWFHEGDYQLGIVCGAVSGNLAVLDFETPASYEDWASRHSGLAKSTRTVETGKGVHVYFLLDKQPAGNTKLIPGLIETRGEGGMVLAPPSLHPSGKAYRLRGSVRTVREVAWGELGKGESWGKEAVKAKISAVEAAKTLMAGNTKGNRNDLIFNAAIVLRNSGKNAQETLELLLESNQRNKPPLADEEIETTVSSAFSKETPATLPTFSKILTQVNKLRERQVSSWTKHPPDPQLTPDYWLEQIRAIVKKAGALTSDEFAMLLKEIEKKPAPLAPNARGNLRKIWDTARKATALLSGRAVVGMPEKTGTWPYDVQSGCLVYLHERAFAERTVIHTTTVADFEAKITDELADEDNTKTFVIAGQAVRGGPFMLEMDAEEFGSDRRLKAKLDAMSGALDPVRAGMGKHLSPAIQKLSSDVRKVKRFKRTGWFNGQFLLPGRELSNMSIQLQRKMAFGLSPNADFTQGLETLEALISSMDPDRSTVVLSTLFQAPLMQVAGWENERYALFISGRTGSLKTSFAQVAMCLYGPGFINDSNLIKWGEGATRTSVMLYAAMAHDLPLLIDNYKPNTGRGSQDFINLIHNIVEGGDKDRANRNAELRETKPLFCLPICTGEDVPGNDPASLARILIVPFKWQRGDENPELSKAQLFHEHLSAVGEAWISWLESDEGRRVAQATSSKFEEYRSTWVKKLKGIRTDTANVLRVASNLSTNQLTWEILAQHPDIGPLAQKYQESHVAGLLNIVAATMAEATAEALEATRYIGALRELYATGRIIMLPRQEPAQQTETERLDLERQKDRIIGWQDEKGVYILPSLARQAAERLLGNDALNNITNAAIFKQLDELGFVVSKSKHRYDKSTRIRDKVRSVLHLKTDTLTAEGDLPCDVIETGQDIADNIPF